MTQLGMKLQTLRFNNLAPVLADVAGLGAQSGGEGEKAMETQEQILERIEVLQKVAQDPDCDEDYRTSLYVRIARLKREAGIDDE